MLERAGRSKALAGGAFINRFFGFLVEIWSTLTLALLAEAVADKSSRTTPLGFSKVVLTATVAGRHQTTPSRFQDKAENGVFLWHRGSPLWVPTPQCEGLPRSQSLFLTPQCPEELLIQDKKSEVKHLKKMKRKIALHKLSLNWNNSKTVKWMSHKKKRYPKKKIQKVIIKSWIKNVTIFVRKRWSGCSTRKSIGKIWKVTCSIVRVLMISGWTNSSCIKVIGW